MTRYFLAPSRAGFLLLAISLLIASALVATSVATAQVRSDGAQTSAKKKKCKITQKRNSKGKCVTKKCKKGYKLSSKSGKCKKIKCKKGYKLSSKSGKCVKVTLDRSDIDGDGIGASREKEFGSNPLRKTIFVQFNYPSTSMRDSLECGQFDQVVNGFANAPLVNPDGSTGIDLLIDAGRTCPSRSYDRGGSRIYSASNPACPGTNDGMTTGSDLSGARLGVYHVAAIQPTCANGGAGGVASLPGIKMVVYAEPGNLAMPLMHELGHNLGLDHGPGNPNRRSVMSVRIFDAPTASSGSAYEVLDFQRYELPALNENALLETSGIGLPPGTRKQYVSFRCPDGSPHPPMWSGWSDGWLDWDCGWDTLASPFTPQDIDTDPVSVDINGDGQKTVLPATPTEWDKITFNAAGQISP